MRDVLARLALERIPKLLTLMDRNPHSPTYGCCDRNAWHYRIIDFPSGMSQEFVWPLALATATDAPGNPFHRQPILREWVRAGIAFAARSAHPDGSCDDYFPFERAAGAAAFSLLAFLESCELLGLETAPFAEFFRRRADWLAASDESGRLSNHQALIALCLLRAGRLLDTPRWADAAEERLSRLLAWQDGEGWFPEYEGFDPGYQSLTLWCLARALEHRPEDRRLREALVRAVDLVGWFVHPDGSFGGEYASRNTYNFFPAGFELIGRWHPPALTINDLVLRGLAAGRGACDEDDHILGHHAWNYLLAWREFVEPRPPVAPRAHGRLHLPRAGLLVERRAGTELYVALNKGGTFKFFSDGRLAGSDTQISLLLRRGRRLRNAVGHLVDRYDAEVREDALAVRGRLGWAKHSRMTVPRMLLLRLAMVTLGRLCPDLVRRLLQRLLITGKDAAPARFERRFEWRDGAWHVTDELHCDDWSSVAAAGIGGDQTSIYVAMSRTYQAGQLQPWTDLMPELAGLADGKPLRLHRVLGGPAGGPGG